MIQLHMVGRTRAKVGSRIARTWALMASGFGSMSVKVGGIGLESPGPDIFEFSGSLLGLY